jgi:hypothetical protein
MDGKDKDTSEPLIQSSAQFKSGWRNLDDNLETKSRSGFGGSMKSGASGKSGS